MKKIFFILFISILLILTVAISYSLACGIVWISGLIASIIFPTTFPLFTSTLIVTCGLCIILFSTIVALTNSDI
jgi:hypothetical protein